MNAEVKRTISNPDVIVYAGFKSKSAFLLAEKLGAFRWYTEMPDNFPANPPTNALVVNWGTGWAPSWARRFRDIRLLNSYESIAASVNKISTFADLSGRGIPTLEYQLRNSPNLNNTLAGWLAADGKLIARDSIEGANGRGIRVVTRREDIGSSPLYTRFYPKTHEFRVHVWNGRVIDTIQKRLMNDAPDSRIKEIRSYDQGWVHSRRIDNFVTADGLRNIQSAAVNATNALGLRFAGIDVLARYENNRFRDCKVCESNSAPDLNAHEHTLAMYAMQVAAEYTSFTGRQLVLPAVTAA